MQGHAACNIVPVVAANRYGLESVAPSKDNGGQKSELLFYGSSFVTDETGELVCQASRDKEEIGIRGSRISMQCAICATVGDFSGTGDRKFIKS